MKPRALIACEESGRVRDALTRKGFDATSCDLLPSRTPGSHYQGDVRDILYDGWDLMIAHPPCTYLPVSGLHWNKNKSSERYGGAQTEEALKFVQLLLNAPIRFKRLENPVSCISSRIREPNQIIQPWMFGDDASKATCFWTENLPDLVLDETKFFPPRVCIHDGKWVMRWDNQTSSGQNKLAPSEDRAMLRSETYQGIADAIAEQDGGHVLHVLGLDLFA